MNVNEHHVGRLVRKLETCRFVPLAEVPAGTTGVVTSVESHGSNPWTRYVVTYPVAPVGAARGWGQCPGTDFEWVS